MSYFSKAKTAVKKVASKVKAKLGPASVPGANLPTPKPVTAIKSAVSNYASNVVSNAKSKPSVPGSNLPSPSAKVSNGGYSTIPGPYDAKTGKLKSPGSNLPSPAGAVKNYANNVATNFKTPQVPGANLPKPQLGIKMVGGLPQIGLDIPKGEVPQETLAQETITPEGVTTDIAQNTTTDLGGTGTGAGTNTNPYIAGHQALQAGGGEAPFNGGEARGVVQDTLNGLPQTPQDSPAVASFMDGITTGQDEGWNAIMDLQKEYDELSTTSLQENYDRLTKESGIDALDTQLMNMQNIIEGTEDDIRTEVEKVGGFATDSQVMALSAARNKTLIQSFNKLVDLRDQMEKHIDRQMSFLKEDKQNAREALNQRMNLNFKIMEYKDKAQTNARESLQKVVDTVGYAGLLQMTGGDPRYQNKAEQILGLPTGSLSELATITPEGDHSADYTLWQDSVRQGDTRSFMDFRADELEASRSVARAGVGIDSKISDATAMADAVDAQVRKLGSSNIDDTLANFGTTTADFIKLPRAEQEAIAAKMTGPDALNIAAGALAKRNPNQPKTPSDIEKELKPTGLAQQFSNWANQQKGKEFLKGRITDLIVSSAALTGGKTEVTGGKTVNADNSVSKEVEALRDKYKY